MRSKNKLPASKTVKERQYLSAGDFSSWLHLARHSLLGVGGIDVVCGECVGCCISSYFIHISPQETEVLGRIRKGILFPAPGFQKGHLLMGHNKNGLCPMFESGKCTIYDHRPQTCRNYDCRVFTAAGIAAGGSEKAVINQRVKCWKFSYPNNLDRDEHLAVTAAATFIEAHANCFPGERVPDNPSDLAILAIKVYDVFLNKGGRTGGPADGLSDADIANAIVDASEVFDAKLLR